MQSQSANKQSANKAKYIGVLLGGCCGDVLGSQTENMKRSDIIAKYASTDGLVKELPRHKKYTDDTEMTIVLARHLTENGGKVTMVTVHDAYARCMTDKGYSQSTRSILNIILSGKRYLLKKGESDHNGCIMRIAPLALIQYKSDDILMQNIDDALFYTHGTDAARWCSFIHCKVLGAILANKFSDKAGLFMYAINLASAYPPLFTKLNIVRYTLMVNSTETNITYELTGNPDTFQITAIDCLCCAYYCFFMFGDPVMAVRQAASMGGDTDTIAKITGELCGALHGVEWIPPEWRGVEDESTLIMLAGKLQSYNHIHQ